MTLEGTNSFLVDAGGGRAFAIDPGPAIPAHVERIAATADDLGLRIEAILVTHGHPDHAPGAAPLALRTGARIYAHADANVPFDAALADGATVRAGGTEIVAFHAPGHAPDHLVFFLESARTLFTGDVIVGRGTILIAPPNGDMREYQATLVRLRALASEFDRIEGGHGDAISEPLAKLDEYVRHREMRERAILATLARGPQSIPEIVAHVYRDTPQILWGAAARQVLAHLIALEREGRVHAEHLERAPTEREDAILNPDVGALVDEHSRAVASAELGVAERIERLAVYERT